MIYLHNIRKILYRLLPIWVVMLSCALSASAQEASKGTVVNNYGNPIEGVIVKIKGTDKVAVTDEEGNFNINAQPNDILVFEHPKFFYKEKNFGTEEKVFFLSNKYLKERDQINVLYDKVDKDSYLGASSTIYTDQIASPLLYSIAGSFAGRLAGMNTIQYGGFDDLQTSDAIGRTELLGQMTTVNGDMPTDNTMYTLNSRGLAPMVVVDGVQRELFDLDAESIESVSIQKDALSSLFLGMRSSRSVLVITTKEPKPGEMKFSFTGRYGVQTSLGLPKPLSADKYAYLLNEAVMNDGGNPVYNQDDIRKFRDGSSPYTHPNVNWYEQLMRSSAPIQSYNFNVSGGTDFANYFVSLGYFDQDGMFKTNDDLNSYDTNVGLKRYSVNSKLNVKVTDKLKVGFTFFGRVENSNQQGNLYTNILEDMWKTPNNAYPIYNPNGSYGGDVSFTNNLMAQNLSSGYFTTEGRDIVATFDINYDLSSLTDGLAFKAISNISTQNVRAINYSMQSEVYQYTPGATEDSEGSYVMYGEQREMYGSGKVNGIDEDPFVSVGALKQFYAQLGFNYDRSFGDHNLFGSIHADYSSILINWALPQKPTNIAFNGKYNYKGKYFAELGLTGSYYNRYKEGDRWGMFYGVGLGWDISKESFVQNVDWVDYLKLRAVYGKTGNGIDNSGYYIYRQTYTGSGDYSYGGSWEGMGENGLANTNVTWEKGHKVNVGLDAKLFKSLDLSVDVYRDYYCDLLQERGRSNVLLGEEYPAENIGEQVYRGAELELTYQNNIRDFNYFVTANWSISQSEVIFQDELYRQNDYNKRTGKPVGTVFGLVSDGFFDSQAEIDNYPTIEGWAVQPGDIKYLDLNEDGFINEYDHTAIGGDKPVSYYGLTLGFEYKRFEMSVLFQGVHNVESYKGDSHLMAGFQGYGQSYGQAYANMENRWTPETMATATYPRLSAGGNSYNLNPNYWSTSFWMRSMDYLRLKDLYVAYTIPDKLSNNLFGGAKLKVFFSGQNLLTWTSYGLEDPEVAFSNYPLQRVVNMGVNVKF